ncbi:MAG TPA: serine hydrolase domain-containing protein [Kofleriaceae bacterium]|nr:serine hydrolase domain-containing protein [Kofleriaceae bacterium]
MRSAWVGLGLFIVACSQPARPVVPKTPNPAPDPAPPPVVAATPPMAEQRFAPATAPAAFADPDRRAKLEAAFPKLDKALEQERVKQGAPGFAIGVVIDGELAYSKGFGVVDPATKAVPDADTIYRIGSISKSFTGLALLSLRDDGLLNLDDPLAKWIPEARGITYPTRDERPITLRQLAQHTAGLPRDGSYDQEGGVDEAAVVGSLAKVSLERAPGLESVYSNLGFSLLGIVVSHAAKLPFQDVIASRIWKPIGMTSTSWDGAGGKLAPAFGPDDKPKQPAKLGASAGDGGIYSSVRDMARYAAFLLAAYPPRDDNDRGPIRRATIREAQHGGFVEHVSVASKPDAKPGEPSVALHSSAYGFGWVQEQTCKETDRIWHNGAIDSYRAALVLRVDRGIGVVVLTNFGAVDPLAFADRAVDALVATGAMKPRVPSLPDPSTYTAAMTAFLDAYNTQDKAKLAAALARPPDPGEPAELAGYKAMHGACSAFKLTSVVNNALQFAMTCEHGPFELDVNMAGDKLGGFTGRSPGTSPPETIRKIFQAAIALQTGPTWSDAMYKLVFPKQQIPEAQARAVAVNLHNQLGTCKAGTFTQDGTGWDLDLVCTKGDPTMLSIYFDAHGDLDGILFRPAAGATASRCPTT